MARLVKRLAAFRSLWRTARAGSHPGSPSLGRRLQAIPRLVSDTVTGRYPGLGRTKLIAFMVGVAYVLSPIDFVPELLIPFVGLGDDVVVALVLAGSLLAETERYLQYKRTSGQTQTP
jgi:uncharacterized membrane protein YkvA (DUF1232 family)